MRGMAAKKSAKNATKKAAKKSTTKTAQPAVTTKTEPTQETPVATPTKQPFPTLAVVSAAVFILIVIIGAVLITKALAPNQENVQSQDVVAIVNGQTITIQEVETVRQALGPQVAMFSEEDIIDQLVLQTLLLQEAETRGISVTRQQAEAEFDTLLLQQGISREEFAGLLAQQGQDLNVLLEEYRKNLMLEALSEELSAGPVTEEEAIAFYEEYKKIAGGEIPPYEELREEIFSFLEQQQQAQALTELAEELESQAQIERY